jgi:two-component system, chemotaxis family, protein-glutamate methylesterase/glutaminase
MTGKKIRVLVVDDSASVRQALTEILNADPQIEVIATASDPWAAAERMRHEIPDVITLDIEMPRMDGLTFLDKLMRQHPIPVVICSSLTPAGSRSANAALEKGAAEVIAKPARGTPREWQESTIRICDAVHAAARAKPVKHVPAKLSADAVLAAPVRRHAMVETTDKVVAIGASTGGTEALMALLSALPPDAPGVVVVQHMPAAFTRQFAARLDAACEISVREAQTGDVIIPGTALIAPGNHHLLVKRSGARYQVEVTEGPLVNRHRPAVDVLFRSTARYAGRNSIGVILTGMGDDGARGMLELHQAGAHTVAQDEASCVVFGMPAKAIELGGVASVLPLDRIAAAIVHHR